MTGWKRWVAIGLGIAVGAPALLCGASGIYGLTLPAELELSVEQQLGADRAAIYDHLDDAEGIRAWWGQAMADYAADNGSDPGMEVLHVAGSPEAGPGCKVDFVAGGVTAETWTILSVEPGSAVVYEVDFKMMIVERTIALAPAEGGTAVTWSETGQLGNPWVRAMLSSMSPESAKENFRGALRSLDKAAGG